MSTVKLAGIVLALGLIYTGYTETEFYIPNIGNPTKIELLDEEFPSEPPEHDKKYFAPIPVIVKHETDALILARAFRDWSDLMEQNDEVKSLLVFEKQYERALQVLCTNTEISNRYQGKLDDTLNHSYKGYMELVVRDNGKLNLEITPNIRQRICRWLDGCSWAFYKVSSSLP